MSDTDLIDTIVGFDRLACWAAARQAELLAEFAGHRTGQDGAATRFQQRRKERRVEVNPDNEGIATLWALLRVPDATAAYQRLSHLARDLGAEDPRSMDARRADLLTDLLTGQRCTATPLDHPDIPDPASKPADEHSTHDGTDEHSTHD